MGIFSQQKDLELLRERLRQVERKCDDLDRQRKALDMEFTELYDKVSHQMSRMAKRYSRAKVNGDEPLDPATEPEPDDGIDPISRSILARRGKRRLTG